MSRLGLGAAPRRGRGLYLTNDMSGFASLKSAPPT
jgi:hypothetical protein